MTMRSLSRNSWTIIWRRKAPAICPRWAAIIMRGAGRSFSIRWRAIISRCWACRCCRCWRSCARKACWNMTLTGKAKLAGIIGWPVAPFPVAGAAWPLAGGIWHRRRHGAAGGAAGRFRRGDRWRAPRRLSRASMSPCRTRKRPSRWRTACDAPAQAAGAANLLVFRDGGIEGRNTDALGLAEVLSEDPMRQRWTAKTWCCWARAARRGAPSWRWIMLGAGKIHLLNRDAAPRQDAGRDRWRRQVQRNWSSRARWTTGTRRRGDAALLVNTTSAGMGSNPPLDAGSVGCCRKTRRSAISSIIRWKPNC